MRILLLALLLIGCPPQLRNNDDDDVTADDDDLVADDDDTGVDLAVLDADAGCGLLPTPNPMPEGNVLVSLDADGSLSVSHFAFSEGCCPEIGVSAALTDRMIRVEVDLFNDFCECICTLDVVYTLSGVPSGEWLLVVNGQELIEVDVP